MTQIEFHNVIGILGVGMIVGMYLLLQLQKVTSTGYLYSSMNAAGAALIIFSLAFEFNLAAFVIEIFWLFISLYGLVLAVRRKKLAATASDEN